MARCRRTAILAFVLLVTAAPPAGARIAFVSDRTEPDIFVMNDDGSNPVDISNNPAPALAPAWSPDATRIVFQRGFGGDADLWLMDADGRNQHPLVSSPGADLAPTWSPDGRRIAFVSDRSGDDVL